jgi:hypothetical protein
VNFLTTLLDLLTKGGCPVHTRGTPDRQWALLERWLASLHQLPALDVVWLEGSLAAGDLRLRANAASDIDIRFAIADADYPQLWQEDRTPLLAGLGEYLLLETTFVRALTTDGIIVEAWAYRTSELAGLAPYEWKILLNRLPAGEPGFLPCPPQSQPETWPDPELLTPDLVRRMTNLALHIMPETPALFYCREPHSIQFTIDFMRIELVKVMYRRLGMRYGKRLKHLSEILPAEWQADLARTHLQAQVHQSQTHVWALTLLALYDVFAKHLQALSEQAGGGFEPVWYARLNQQVAAELRQFA